MTVAVRSFAKINIGLRIGAARDDGFHELRTIYHTIGLHDVVKVDVQRGVGIEIRCKDPRVPADETNTCWRVAERVLRALKQRGKVIIQIEKQLPVQGGLGAASSNGVATLLGLERSLKAQLPPEERLRIAAEVGSDLPLFLVGGMVLGVGRGQEVYPMRDLPALALVVATPAVSVSTPAAFTAWDRFQGGDRFQNGPKTGDERNSREFDGGREHRILGGGDRAGKLTGTGNSDTINNFSRSVFGWLCGTQTSGVPQGKASSLHSGDRAETLLLDLVRAGIENDFERVVFLQYPELREVKRVLERAGARYCSLSGSGAAVYGLFASANEAQAAAEALTDAGIPAQATATLPRREYWEQVWK
jgi:4-diphosphocytidyl-2-C-methyl-D-erythritol kinase